MFMGFIIWSIVTILFVGIGLKCRKSDEPTGFFIGCKPPIVEDIQRYNKAVSKLWFAAAVIYEIMGMPLLFLEQNSLFFIPIIFGVVVGLIVMMVVYLKIEGKYRK